MNRFWKKIKKGTINIWNVLDGNKTTIGAILLVAAKGGKAFAPNLLDPAQYDFVEMVGAGLAGVGIGHKVIKAKPVNDAIKRAQRSIRKDRQ